MYAALPYRAAESGHTPQVREGVGMVSRGLALIEGVQQGPSKCGLHALGLALSEYSNLKYNNLRPQV